MRILLVGNYALDNQMSMSRYAEFLRDQMTLRGHHVEILRPPVVLGGASQHAAIRKWLGYVDKYLLFPPRLRERARDFDLVHICDHSNSMYLPHTSGCPSSITCHDLLAIAAAGGCYPQQKISATGKLQQRWIRKHLARARHVVCVSHNTARELAEHVRRDAPVTVIPNSLSISASRATPQSVSELRTRLGLAPDEQYLFHIGGVVWYKNRLGVLRIYQAIRQQLSTSSIRLIMAGAPFTPPMRAFVKANHLQDEIIEVVEPSDDELCTLYAGALALLFPSLYEGFGWPIIEAQSCSCPVITSNRPPMTEVGGDSVLYIDPDDEPAAAAHIAANLHHLPSLREAGLRNVSRFEPGIAAPQYETFFASVARCNTLHAASSQKGTSHEEPSGNL